MIASQSERQSLFYETVTWYFDEIAETFTMAIRFSTKAASKTPILFGTGLL